MNVDGKLIILGASGHGKDVFCIAEACGREIVGFLDDADRYDSFMGKPVLGKIDDWHQFEDVRFIVGVGDPRIRSRIVSRLESSGKPIWDTLIHPSFERFNAGVVGEGTVIMPGSIFAADVSVGRHCVISLSVTLGHDDRIGDFCTLAPKATVSGSVTCEPGVEIGTLAAVRQGLTLSAGSLLGMGGILTKSTDPNQIYIGNPAKPFKELPEFV